MTRRKRFGIAAVAFAAALLAAVSLQAASPVSPVHHDIQVTLFPEIHRLEVEDTITLPKPLSADPGASAFYLHGKLYPASMTPGAELTLEEGRPDPALLGPEASSEALPVETYRVSLSGEVRTFKIKYSGHLDYPQDGEGEKYGRGMEESPGSISSDGIFLAASSFWYPVFPGHLVSFTLEAHLPEGWNGVSQGKRTAHSQDRGGVRVRWESPEPQDEIYLAGNQFTEYHRAAGPVTAMAFLRKPDPALAEKYLTATGQYLEMYQKLIGPYPYTKFALVENFWDSGYGMPSFTLLGPQIIRFPFVLHSSYPHEILHNWWGNGVFVDFQSGNWSEGLTAYLADHLISEQRGEGAAARQASLQKYTDYVSEGKDFPLTAFRSRHSAATEAVGYGKTLMFFHMLRLELGDDLFIRSLQTFYRENKFKAAGFADLEQAFSKTSGRDLKSEFKQWTAETGAPMLRLNDPEVKADGAGYLLTARLDQLQPGPPYRLQIPVAVTLEGGKAYRTAVTMTGKEQTIHFTLPARPLRIDVDPEFDLFRRLDRREIPPALSQAFGAPKSLIVLPSAAPAPLLEGYRRLAESWKGSQGGEIEIKLDSDLKALPKQEAVWLFGWENRFKPGMTAALDGYDVAIEASQVRLGAVALDRRSRSVVLVGRQPENPDAAFVWLAADRPAALPGLARKLPHYGRYGYLGFEGDEPSNVMKGAWPLVHSPLTRWIPGADGGVVKAARAKELPRQALASLPPPSAAPSPPAEKGTGGDPFSSERKVSLGTIPDFVYRGKGVRLMAVLPGSPAEKGGLKGGDVIVRAGTAAVENLRGFADILKALQPGEQVAITFLRDGREQTVEIEAAARQ